MNILVIGGGGREHALVWKLAQSPHCDQIYCAPGNAGIAGIAECVAIGADNLSELLAFAQAHQVGLTVVGPEVPLTHGIVDLFQAQGLKIFGPSQQAARLEGSKIFAKQLMQRYGIPTAGYHTFTDLRRAMEFVDEQPLPLVIKADGLAAGKGVVVAQTRTEARDALQDMLGDNKFGEAGHRVVIEECLQGEEASLLAFTDGTIVVPMVAAQDHKRVGDGDTGPNTGGMGAYAPAPVVTEALRRRVMDEVLLPTVQAMKREGCSYRGVLYAGLMITADGPKVIEFNARFGDPETQVILPLLKSDLVEIMLAVCDGCLAQSMVEWYDLSCACVVMAAQGYPGTYRKGVPISGLAQAAAYPDTAIFHAGTKQLDDQIVTDGGRVLAVTATGTDIEQAVAAAYRGVKTITFDGAHYRGDIAWRALPRD